ncbi:hypothetical protein [Desulfoplanes sp.]
MKLSDLKEKIRSALATFEEINKERATETLEWEVGEMENIFAVLVLGSFIGIPSPPIQVTLELLPLMERELLLMTNKVATSSDPLAEVCSVLDAF